MKATNIEWDIPSDCTEQLPNEIEIPKDALYQMLLQDRHIKESVSDYIVSLTGFRHNGFILG